MKTSVPPGPKKLDRLVSASSGPALGFIFIIARPHLAAIIASFHQATDAHNLSSYEENKQPTKNNSLKNKRLQTEYYYPTVAKVKEVLQPLCSKKLFFISFLGKNMLNSYDCTQGGIC